MSPTNRIGILVVLFVGAVLIGVGVATLFNKQYAVEPIQSSTQPQVPTQLAAGATSAPSSVPAVLVPQATAQDTQATSNTTSFPASSTAVTVPATPTLQLTEVPTTLPSSTVQPTNADPTQPPPQSTELATTQLTPTVSAPATDQLLQKVAAAIDMLQRGQLQATIEYPQGTGSRSQAQLQFEFGKTVGEQRFHMITTYQGDQGTQTSEQIMIGETTWSRQGTGEWTKAPAQTSVHHQVQSFLPNVSSVTNPTIISDATTTMVRWYDAARDADVTLTVDPATGVPQQMRQLTRATGSVLTVNYSGWNAAVDVKPPAVD